MKPICNIFYFLCFVTSFVIAQTQGPITVDNTTYTPQELIEDVLIKGGCTNISNFSSSISEASRGIGYFERGATIPGVPDNFPFANGIILSTGNVLRAPGPSTPLANLENGNPGDADLEAASNIVRTRDRSFIQFDFIPPSNRISFNYLFASEEYNQNYECRFSDAFAFILTDLTTNTVTNLAILPTTNTGSQFVTCTNVRPDVDGFDENGDPVTCNAQNEQYFDKYNFSDTDPSVAANSPIVYDGQTIPFTASATVVAGNRYSIKLVIADHRDRELDSAVFLEGADFGGVEIALDAPGFQVVNGSVSACNGESVTINSSVTSNAQLNLAYQWSFQQNGVSQLIPGATSPSIVANNLGTYTLTASYTFPGGVSCSDTKSMIVNIINPEVIGAPNISLCNPNSDTGVASFTLTDNNASVLGGQSATANTITYHLSEQDAINDVNPLTSPYTNISNPQKIWIRIEANGRSCFDTGSFDIEVTNLLIEPTATLTACDQDLDDLSTTTLDEGRDGVVTFDLSAYQQAQLNPEIISAGGNIADYTITFHTALDANGNPTSTSIINSLSYQNINTPNQIIYANILYTGSSVGCSSVKAITLHVDLPPATSNTTIQVCDDEDQSDGIHEFNLTDSINQITGGVTANMEIDFYTVRAEAESGSGVALILNPDRYENTVSPETIFVRTENMLTGCYTISEIELIVDSKPNVSIEANFSTLCVDSSGGLLDNVGLPILTVTVTPVADYSFQWALDGVAIPGSNNQAISTSLPGNYTVTVSGLSSVCGDVTSDPKEIQASGPPDSFNSSVATNDFSNSHQIISSATSSNPNIQFVYSLDGGSPQDSGVFDDVSPGLHTVTISDTQGCWSEDLDVVIIDYPPFFTPNNDGIRDTWHIIGMDGISISQLHIYDRFGKLLKELDPEGEGWDGVFNGKKMPATDYWFRFEYVKKTETVQREFRAHFSLVR